MVRNAKKSLTFKEIANTILKEVDPELRVVKCPMNFKPNKEGMTSIVRCCTSCVSKCSTFISFKWVIEGCANQECQYNTPCIDCLINIADLKVAIKALSIANRAFIGEYSSRYRVKEWGYRRRRK